MFHKILAALPLWLKKRLQKVSYTLPDRVYISLWYFFTYWKILSLNHPRTYTEKIQRLKTHQTGPQYVRLVDKYIVRAVVREKIPEDILVPLYRHGTDPEDIPFNSLPDSFVIKCNHGSKYNLFVQDKTKADQEAIKQQVATRLQTDFWRIARELQYKWIQKQICIEQLLVDDETGVPRDYKFYCFQWVPKYIIINSDRFTSPKSDIFDTERNEQRFSCVFPKSEEKLKQPTQLAKMLEYARTLSTGMPFVRVDFYQVNNKVYFGEITLTPDAGHWFFFPNHNKVDLMLWDLIDLSTHFNYKHRYAST